MIVSKLPQILLPILFAIVFHSRYVFAITSICGWEGLRGTQIQSKIILEGGIMSGGTFSNGKCAGTGIIQHSYGVYYQIDLTKSFDAAKQNSSEYLRPGKSETSNTLAPNYVAGGIFNNNYQFYTFGGLADRPPIGESTVILGNVFPSNPAVTRFDEGISPNQQTDGVSDNITSGAYASSPDQGLGFYFGGMVSSTGRRLEYNSRDNATNHPTNASATFIKVDMTTPNDAKFEYGTWPSGLTPRSEGALVWLPFGAKGVLVAIGGVEIPGDRFIKPPRITNGSTFMTELAVYDIDGDTWYTQRTKETGQKPTQLASFCTVVVPTQDKASYEIFVYGGYDGTYTSIDPNVRDDVWVLSIPAFQWTKVKSAESGSLHGRQGSVCFSPNPTSMITVGGTGKLGGAMTSETAIDVLDLNNLTWTGKFNASSTAAFVAPSSVVSQLGWPADGKGPGADTKAVDLNGTLTALFSTRYSGEVKTYYPYSNDTGSGNNGSVKTSNNHWKIPVIATLCTVIPVALIAISMFLCFRQRRKNQKSMQRGRRSSNVFSWLGKIAPIDPSSEKSQTSGDTGRTLVGDHADFLRQHGYKNVNGEIYEAASAPGPIEIMDHPQTDKISVPATQTPMSTYQHTSWSSQNTTTSELNAMNFTIPRKPAPRSLSQQMYELPDGTDKNSAQSPIQNSDHVRSEGTVSTPTNGAPSPSVVGFSPADERDPYRPSHRRHTSSMSSGMPSLPSPRQDPTERARQLSPTPDLSTPINSPQETSGHRANHLSG